MKTLGKFESNSVYILEKVGKIIRLLIFASILALILMTLMACSSDPAGEEVPDPNRTGSVQGTVKDEDGNAYPNTQIKVSKGAEERIQRTDKEGKYSIKTSDVGPYSLEITPPLSTEIITANPSSANLEADKTITANFVISPKPVKAHLNFGEVQLLEEIVDKDGNTPIDPNEPLYAANIFDEPLGMLTAIKAPDDHHVTLAEFKQAKGNLRVRCDGDSAAIEVELEGLIPNGTYTFWLAYLNKTRKVSEPIDFANDFVNFTNPPIGAADGTENIAVADANGSIYVTLSHDSCILTDEVALVIPVLYHINGKTFGGGHVPDPEEVVQMLAYFQ
ncbi:MAG: carboxypeptidase-like regulatory domain-containing protein [Flavobacteriaceae bacterium]